MPLPLAGSSSITLFEGDSLFDLNLKLAVGDRRVWATSSSVLESSASLTLGKWSAC